MRRLIVGVLAAAGLALSTATSAVEFARFDNQASLPTADALYVIGTGIAPSNLQTLPSIKWASQGPTYLGYVAGLLVPPADGEYTFYTAADDYSAFFLSLDDNMVNAVQICSVASKTTVDQWNKVGTQKSAPRTLKAGQAYAFYVVMSQGMGSDHCSVGWTGPEPIGQTIKVIDGQYVRDPSTLQEKPSFAGARGAAVLAGAPASLAVALNPSMRPWTFTLTWYRQDPAGDLTVGAGRAYTVPKVADADEGTYYCVADGVRSPVVGLDVVHGLIHRYTFNDGDVDGTRIKDVVGGLDFDGVLHDASGNDKIGEGKLTLGNSGQTSNKATGSYVDLPNGMFSTGKTQLTVEVWWTNTSSRNGNERVFDFGTSNGGENTASSGSNSTYLYLCSRNSVGNIQVGYHQPQSAGNMERTIQPSPAGPAPVNRECLYTVVWDEVAGLCKFYFNGVIVGRNLTHFRLSELVDKNNWIGRAQWDYAYAEGSVNELRIWDMALGANEIARHYRVGPEDVSLSPPPMCLQQIVGDENADCVVDFMDYAAMVERWMMDTSLLQ